MPINANYAKSLYNLSSFFGFLAPEESSPQDLTNNLGPSTESSVYIPSAFNAECMSSFPSETLDNSLFSTQENAFQTPLAPSISSTSFGAQNSLLNTSSVALPPQDNNIIINISPNDRDAGLIKHDRKNYEVHAQNNQQLHLEGSSNEYTITKDSQSGVITIVDNKSGGKTTVTGTDNIHFDTYGTSGSDWNGSNSNQANGSATVINFPATNNSAVQNNTNVDQTNGSTIINISPNARDAGLIKHDGKNYEVHAQNNQQLHLEGSSDEYTITKDSQSGVITIVDNKSGGKTTVTGTNNIHFDTYGTSGSDWNYEVADLKAKLSNSSISQGDLISSLFPDTNLKQHSIGDCYLDAAMEAVLKSPNGTQKLANLISYHDGAFYVTFPGKKSIKVTNDMLNDKNETTANGLGPTIIECAYGEYKSGKSGSISQTDGNDKGGNPESTLSLLTGNSSSSSSGNILNQVKGILTGQSGEASAVSNIYDQLKQNKVIACVSFDKNALSKLKDKSGNQPIDGHAYTLEVDPASGDILVINPWDTQNDVLRYSKSDFLNNFKGEVDYTNV